MTRVLHLIDSLAPGGAERVAVNMANEMNQQGHTAWLCATRAEGMLKEHLSFPGRYIFLSKQRATDLRAFFRLVKWLRDEKIEIIHAHSTSIYWGVPLKWFTGCKLVWHDHYGDLEHMHQRPKFMLQVCSLFVDRVCSVNKKLAAWSRKNLWISSDKIFQVNHFASLSQQLERTEGHTVNILCVANLRPQKDHSTLLEALHRLAGVYGRDGWAVYLVGEEKDARYAELLKAKSIALGLSENVQFVGPQLAVEPWLFKSQIGVLSSRSEGLPVALLEYGLAGLAVVCTDVGSCGEVLGDGRYGILVPPADSRAMADALQALLVDRNLRATLGNSLAPHTRDNYSSAAAIHQIEKIYQEILG